QQELQRQEIKEAERVRKSREEQGAMTGGKDDKMFGVDDESSTCPRFNIIEIIGNKVYSKKYLARKITNKYIGNCINKKNLATIQNEIMTLYIENGYTLARVYFDMKKTRINDKENTFVIVIEEGKVNTIKIQDETEGKKPKSISDNRGTFFAFPFAKNGIFNLKDFEQGLDQINRLQSNDAIMDIRPSKGNDKDGYSDIEIINKRKSFRTTFLDLSFDNAGNKNVGENNVNISVNQDNLLGIYDNIYIKYTNDLEFDTARLYNRSLYSNFSLPFGYWTLSASVTYSEYKTTVEGYYTSFNTNGNTFTQLYSLDRVMYRTGRFKTNLGAALEIRDTESYIRDVKSLAGSRKSSNVNIYLNNTLYTSLGTIIVKPSYQRGLALFGAKEDASDLMDIEPRLQYDLFKLYAYFNTRINMPLLTKSEGQNSKGEVVKLRNKLPLNYTLTIDSQYSLNTLYGTNQFSTGGLYTVRGFKESTISGDNGYYIRNDLKANLQHLFPRTILQKDFMNKGSSWLDSPNTMLAKTHLSVFYDFGYIENKHDILPDTYNANKGYMAGAGVALNYYGKYFTWSLTYAKALHSPTYLQSRDGVEKEDHNIYWRISANW
ncbi:MAG: hypothetical protein LBR35_00760, partial [Rickettsiales bacterium]|nr:hypothetical protein [Rickettsiales bacterium]